MSATNKSTSPTPTPTPTSPSPSATLAPRSPSPPSRKRTSSPRQSAKEAIIGDKETFIGPSSKASSSTRTDAEHITATVTATDFGVDAARRASMPAKYHTRDQHLGGALSRPISPRPTPARESEPPSTTTDLETTASVSTSSSRSTIEPPSRPSSATPVKPVSRQRPLPIAVVPLTPAPTPAAWHGPPTPASSHGPTKEASTLFEGHGEAASPTDDDEAPPTYDMATGLPQSQGLRTEWMLRQLFSKMDRLTFNLPGPLYAPITLDTFRRKGRGDLVEGRTIEEVGNLVFTHTRTWNASRCNVKIPDIDPRAQEVKCKVLSDSENFESPTHLLVITSGAGDARTYTYVAVHDIVYLAQCVGLRAGLFPQSHPRRVQEEDGTFSVTLPIVVLHMPANHCFGLLDDYFYNRNLTYFFQQLISPLMPTAQERHQFENNYQRCQFYVRLLLQYFSFPEIARRLLAIHHLHQDAMCLGVVDISFWRVVNVAWFCCGAALKGKKNEILRQEAVREAQGTGTTGRSASMPQLQH